MKDCKQTIKWCKGMDKLLCKKVDEIKTEHEEKKSIIQPATAESFRAFQAANGLIKEDAK